MYVKKKVLLVFGTRPEAIKMSPVVKELEKSQLLEVIVCVTGQHKEMLWQVLDTFQIHPKYDLNIMKEKQTLTDITALVLQGVSDVIRKEKPNLVLVHGDTSTAFATALAAYYEKTPIGHVEAGLRTYNINSPFPEEYNRQAISLITTYHFAPTSQARKQLELEGKSRENIFVTGNTAIDAMQYTIQNDYSHPILEWAKNNRLILLTSHRRENLGSDMQQIFLSVKEVVEQHKEVKVVFPVHKNPVIREMAYQILGDCSRIRLIEPLPINDMHNIMNQAYFILTDSGGIQEEAPAINKPVLVLRNETERIEGVEAGTLCLVGTDPATIIERCNALLQNTKLYNQMCNAKNPYGDGTAAEQIRKIIEKVLS